MLKQLKQKSIRSQAHGIISITVAIRNLEPQIIFLEKRLADPRQNNENKNISIYKTMRFLAMGLNLSRSLFELIRLSRFFVNVLTRIVLTSRFFFTSTSLE